MISMKNYKKYWKLGRPEYNTEFFDINKDGELLVKEGNYQYNLNKLVKKYGTSLEINFPYIIEKRLTNLLETFGKYTKMYGYKGKVHYNYPMKVNQNKEVVLAFISAGANIEVGSKNELWLVKQMWEEGHFNNKIRVLCNGPKTQDYIDLISSLRAEGLNIVPIVEDKNEYLALKKFKGNIGIRINLDVKVSSRWDKKVDRFGLLPEEILSLGRVHNLKLLHYHIGSQIEKSEDVLKPFRRAAEVFRDVRKINPTLDTIDLGGGLSVPYEKKKSYSVDNVVKRIIGFIKKFSDDEAIPAPDIIVEWGRYIVAPAQITIYQVVFEKPIATSVAQRWYVIDGSFMNDLLDTWAIHQKWHVVPVNYIKNKKLSRVWLAGSSCDSDDKYTAGGSYVLLPRLEDLNGEPLYIAFFDTGAYQDPLASHHCLLSSPAKIIVQDGQITMARKRESAKDVGKLFGW